MEDMERLNSLTIKIQEQHNEIIRLKKQNANLLQENEELSKDLGDYVQKIRRLTRLGGLKN